MNMPQSCMTIRNMFKGMMEHDEVPNTANLIQSLLSDHQTIRVLNIVRKKWIHTEKISKSKLLQRKQQSATSTAHVENPRIPVNWQMSEKAK